MNVLLSTLLKSLLIVLQMEDDQEIKKPKQLHHYVHVYT